jgi:uncharacterized zinc-type alcohol dehydrogenase-like protein
MYDICGKAHDNGSPVGGIAETQEVIDCCLAPNTAGRRTDRPDQNAAAYDRLGGKGVRYRFVIDCASAKQAQ